MKTSPCILKNRSDMMMKKGWTWNRNRENKNDILDFDLLEDYLISIIDLGFKFENLHFFDKKSYISLSLIK